MSRATLLKTLLTSVLAVCVLTIALVWSAYGQVACTRWNALSLDQTYTLATSGQPQCFSVSVPAGSYYATVHFKALNGNYQLYWEPGFRLTQLTNDIPLTFQPSLPELPFGPPLFRAVTEYTLVVNPLASIAASNGFRIRVTNDGDHAEIAESDSDSAGSGGLTTTPAQFPGIRIAQGPNAQVIYTFNATCPGPIEAEVSWDSSSNRMHAQLYNPAGQVVDSRSGEPAPLRHTLSAADLHQGTQWYVLVTNNSAASAITFLTLTKPDDTCPTPPPPPTATRTRTPLPRPAATHAEQSAAAELPAQPVDAYYRIWFANNCDRPIRLALRYKKTTDEWTSKAWWTFSAGSARYLKFSSGDQVRTNNRIVYYFAETTDGSNRRWAGDYERTYNDETLPMRRKRMSLQTEDDERRFYLGITCS